MRYFMVLPAEWFREGLAGSLRECWRRRSFRAITTICEELTGAARNFIQCDMDGTSPPLTLQVPRGLAFDPNRWRLLAGELMLFAAVELPEIETPLVSYDAVLGHALTGVRTLFYPLG